jgi:ankyrin repeat protein
MQCCAAGDTAQLRRWARQGVRVVSGLPLCAAALLGKVDLLRILIKELGADANQAIFGSNDPTLDGSIPLLVAAQYGHVAALRCLVKEFGAAINQAGNRGDTPLYIAAAIGHLCVVQCLVKEHGVDVNQATHNGFTPLMIASARKHTDIVVWLSKHGADAQAFLQGGSTAADVSRYKGAPAEQTEYLEARTHCANPGCDGAGLKKCAGCLKVFFCGPACIRAHWPAHKAECKRIAEAAASKEK